MKNLLRNLKKLNKKNGQKGQVILLAVLVGVVVMTIALSASRRATVDIQQLQDITEANRAFTAAESGVEDKLLELKETENAAGCSGDECAQEGLDFGDSKVVGVNVEEKQELTISDIPEEQTVELKLNDGSVDFDGVLTVGWKELSSMVLTAIVQTSSGGYETYREAYNCGGNYSNGFTQLNASNGSCTRQLNIANVESQFAAENGEALILRLRPMYQDTNISVTGTGLPVQATSITSTGQAGEAQRTVEATRTKQMLPAIFDFVLFSGSTTQKVGN